MKKIVSLLYVVLVMGCCSCEKEVMLRDFKDEYNNQIIQKYEVYSKENEVCYTVCYSPNKKQNFIFDLFFEIDNSNNVNKVWLKQKRSDTISVLFEGNSKVDINTFLSNLKIEQYAYNILCILGNGIDTWINVCDYMTQEEYMQMETNIIHPSDFCDRILNDAYLLTPTQKGDEVFRVPERYLDELKNLLSEISDEDFYVNVGGRPTWAIYAKIYFFDNVNMHEIKLCTAGIVVDGVFYETDNEKWDDMVKELSGKDEVY